MNVHLAIFYVYLIYVDNMDYEQDDEYRRILEGPELNEILDASPDESPELLVSLGLPQSSLVKCGGAGTPGGEPRKDASGRGLSYFFYFTTCFVMKYKSR